MNIWNAVLLGIVQGLTEFLPVSSSGHLILISEIFGIAESNMFFSVMLHFGTLMAVLVFYFKELLGLLSKEGMKTVGFLALASVPAALTGLLLGDMVDSVFSDSTYLCFTFMATAVLLLIIEIYGRDIKNLVKIGWKHSLFMGVMQGIAIVPGLSRSGFTISGGLAAKGERNEVAKFSFFMSIPVILGAFVLELIKADFSEIFWLPTIIGMAAAFISGLAAISFMLKIIGKCNFKWFSLYLAAVSILTYVNNYVTAIWS